jgi:hypothetical protein
MCLGVFPSDQIASRYQLSEFVQLGKAIQQGNLLIFNQIMTENQSIFIKHGIYLVLEQTKMILFRNLVRRLYLVFEKNIKFPMSHLEIAINYQLELFKQERATDEGDSYRIEDEENMDLNEIECILSNLIYANRIKGYILHEKRLLVLSNKDPFPAKEIIKKFVATSNK